MMLRKLGTSANKMVYSEGTFLWWGLFIPSFKPIAYVVDKQRDVCRSTFCYRDYVCQVSKLQHIYIIGLMLLSVPETTKQIRLYQAIYTFQGFVYAATRLRVWKTIPSSEFAYISCILYIWLLCPISILIKNLCRRKKVYIKVFLNQFMLILIIYYL